MSETTVRIPVSNLTALVVEVLHSVSVPRDDGAIVADCLLMANLSGVDSHGVVRLAHYVRRLSNGSIKARPEIRFERASPAVGRLDGGHGLGHVVGHRATTAVMELAAEAGTGAVSVGNSSHFGMAGYYALRMAAQGYIGLCMTPTDPFLVPYGGSQPFFGTNAICLGFPAVAGPVVVDMATTTISYGKVALAAVEGTAIPDNWGVGAQGNPNHRSRSGRGAVPGERSEGQRTRNGHRHTRWPVGGYALGAAHHKDVRRSGVTTPSRPLLRRLGCQALPAARSFQAQFCGRCAMN